MPTVPDIHQRGTRAAQPLAADVTIGTIYCVTDEGDILERSTGAAWESYSPAVATGTGDVAGPAASIASEIALFDGTTGKLLKRATGTGPAKVTSGVLSAAAIDLSGSEVTGTIASARLSTQHKTRVLTFAFSNGSSDLAVATQAVVSCPYTGTITGARLLSPQTAAVVIDVWKDVYANYPPTIADTITASAKPTLSAANKSDNTTLTGWTTSVTAGDVFIANIDSCTGVHSCALQLTLVLS
jgi:hypothetical protein